MRRFPLYWPRIRLSRPAPGNLKSTTGKFQIFGGYAMSGHRTYINFKYDEFFTRQAPFRVTLYDCPQGVMEGGEHMSPSERRQKLLEVLCLRRHDTCANLAHEFHVCQRTIRYDIEALMCSYPIETICGRFGGGVRVNAASCFFFRPPGSSGRLANRRCHPLRTPGRTAPTRLSTMLGMLWVGPPTRTAPAPRTVATVWPALSAGQHSLPAAGAAAR